MVNIIEIKSPIKEWTVFQEIDGTAEINLFGVFSISDAANYPVVKVVDITEKVIIYKKVETQANNWSCCLKLAVGMYRIETGIALKEANFNPKYLKKGHIIRNIFVGENFLIAGQSNAVGFGKEEVFDNPQYGVCMYNCGWHMATHPIGHMGEKVANSDYLNSGHSAWLNFGKLILNNLKKPVGLIPAGLGGTSITDWAKDSALFKNAINLAKQTNAKHLIWYQGCSDVFANLPDLYKERLYSLVLEFKRLLNDINVYIVQVSGTTNINNPDVGWRKIREIQREVALLTNSTLVPTYDLIEFSDDIHLGSKDNIKLSIRLYDAYLNKTMPLDISYKVKENSIVILFCGINIDINTAQNIVALDKNYDELNCKISVEQNEVTMALENVNDIKYISLSFGRLYNNKPLYDDCQNLLPYFCKEINVL